MSRFVTRRFGLNVSNASVQKDFNKLRRACRGYGNSLEELIREYDRTTNDNSDSYVLSIVDESETD